MRRLRTLSEAECYARCYGSGEAAVRIVRIRRRRPIPALQRVSGEELRAQLERRIDLREPEAA
jgi:hypothetical protein